MRLLNDLDDLQFLRGRISHSSSPPSAMTLFLRRRFYSNVSASTSFSCRVSTRSSFTSGLHFRTCDVVRLLADEIAPNGLCVDRATIRQRKTSRPVRFEIMEQTRQSVQVHLTTRRHQQCPYLFPSRNNPHAHLSTRQYARLVSGWIDSIGLDATLYGTHSLRRTKATLIYRRTGNLRAVQLLLGHTKIESTVRYLGVEVDDALALSEQVDV